MTKQNAAQIAFHSIAAVLMIAFSMMAAVAAPSIEQYAVPSTLHHLQATVVHKKANQAVLQKIGAGFADGYRVTSASYAFTAPDRLEVHAHSGMLSATQVYTNTTRRTDFGFIHKTDDISSDITKRETIFGLGLLPQNYLDTVRATYVGPDTVNSISCDVFMLRYITDRIDDNRRFKVWISKDKHYVVKKIVWDGGDHEHETIVYSEPVQAMPGLWVPTQVEAFDKEGALGGIAQQTDIKAD